MSKKHTAKAIFDINYVKDVLKLMTKLSKEASSITVSLGNDSVPAKLQLNGCNGVICEIAIAPRLLE
jgi:hypothetical protein